LHLGYHGNGRHFEFFSSPQKLPRAHSTVDIPTKFDERNPNGGRCHGNQGAKNVKFTPNSRSSLKVVLFVFKIFKMVANIKIKKIVKNSKLKRFRWKEQTQYVSLTSFEGHNNIT
jgi:hypothetical protein